MSKLKNAISPATHIIKNIAATNFGRRAVHISCETAFDTTITPSLAKVRPRRVRRDTVRLVDRRRVVRGIYPFRWQSSIAGLVLLLVRVSFQGELDEPINQP